MKKDKEWLKESINELKTIFNGRKMSGYVAGMLDGYNHASMLIDHLDEPEKPVIPQFVADYIEQSKKDNDSINQVFAFMDDKEDKDLWHWLFPSMYEEKRANQEVFMRAWLDGYEVEKEKLYRVRAGNRYVRFNLDGSIIGVKKDNSIVCLERLSKLPFDYQKAIESGIITLEEVTE